MLSGKVLQVHQGMPGLAYMYFELLILFLFEKIIQLVFTKHIV